MSDPSPEARKALSDADEALQRVRSNVSWWRRTATDVRNATAANHFADFLAAMARSTSYPRRDDPGDTPK